VQQPFVRTERLACTFSLSSGLFGRRHVNALADVDLEIARGELLALVGESGSGKSTLGRALVRLVQPTGGRVFFDGTDISRLRGRALREFRSRAQIIFQNPYQSLNPRLRVGDALAEVLDVWRPVRKSETDASVRRLLETVHLPASYARKYPHELSGGERQRVAIARAIAVQPQFLVADEPVSSLDVSASARVLNLLLELREHMRFTCLFITHDLALAGALADRIAVMNLGRIIETGTADQIFRSPKDDYTRALLEARLTLPNMPR
jgi:ABC-type glutathione transport system ATPase component